MLVAYGPNRVEVPCRLFESKQQGQEFIQELAAKYPTLVTISRKGIGFDIDADEIGNQRDDDGQSPVGDALMDALFTHYYGGCGEAYSFNLVDVPVNAPFVAFDLD